MKLHGIEKLHQTTDAKVWAQEFIRIIKDDPTMALDEGFMIGWFANAIMIGYDSVLPLDQSYANCRYTIKGWQAV